MRLWLTMMMISSILAATCAVGAETGGGFAVRGVVIAPEDLSLATWPEMAKGAGLTTVALHDGKSPAKVIEFARSEAGQAFLEKCRKLGLEVEYEIHAASELLPRSLFAGRPDMFRMNDDGKRTPDGNFCVSSSMALAIACQKAREICETLVPTAHRYFLWTDDNHPGCRCPLCKDLSDSDQALILENAILAELQLMDPEARVAHLAYGRTLEPPCKVKPEKRVFLEFAPINRDHRKPLSDPANKAVLDVLDANLRVFPAATAQALDYWLDCSLFSGWKKPQVKVELDEKLVRDDLSTYAGRGIRNVSTFAVLLDAGYVEMHGQPPVRAYGRCFR